MFGMFKKKPPPPRPAWHDEVEIDLSDGPPQTRPQASAPAIALGPSEPEQNPVIAGFAQRALLEIQAEEIRRGQPYTDEERMVLMQATGFRLVDEWLREQRQRQAIEDMSDDLGYAVDSMGENLSDQLGRISEQLDEPRDAVGRAIKFQQEHPFLAGFIGAEIVHKLKDK